MQTRPHAKRKLAEGRWLRITEVINFEVVNSAERRQREHAPPEGKEQEYIAGTAFELDLLAIYR